MTITPLIRKTLIAMAFFLGTTSVLLHTAEYGRDIRYSKDFALDYSSARAFLDGRDPYEKIRELVDHYLDPPPHISQENILPGGNWHPPFKVVITVPFALLPYEAAGVLWLLFSAACFVLAGVLLARELGWRRIDAWALGWGFVAVPVVGLDLSAGNLNGQMLLLLILVWRALRRVREGIVGLGLGLVVALKPFPAFLALPMLSARRFRPVIMAAIVAASLTLFGFVVVGLDHVGSFLREGGGEEGFGYWDSSPANISWWGVVTRWLTANGWVDGVDLGGVAVGLAIAGAVGFGVLALRPPTGLTGDRFWAAVPLMLLAWPIVWIHYAALAVPWVLLAVRGAVRRRRAGLVIAASVVGIAILMGFPPGLPSLDTAGTLAVALGYQVPTAALVAAVLLEAWNRTPDGEVARMEPAEPTATTRVDGSRLEGSR